MNTLIANAACCTDPRFLCEACRQKSGDLQALLRQHGYLSNVEPGRRLVENGEAFTERGGFGEYDTFADYSPEAQLKQMGIDRGQWDEDDSEGNPEDENLEMPSSLAAFTDQRSRYPKRKSAGSTYAGDQYAGTRRGSSPLSQTTADDPHGGAYDDFVPGTPSPLHNQITTNHVVSDGGLDIPTIQFAAPRKVLPY